MKTGGVCWSWLFLAVAGCAGVEQSRVVCIENGLDMALPSETVVIARSQFGPLIPGTDPTSVAVVAMETGERLLTQAVDLDGDGVVDELLFQTDLGPQETRRFELRPRAEEGQPEPAQRTFGRFVPERMDDFAWENDLVAFRMYGPALAADAVNSGVDCWLKRVPYPIVDKWYQADQEGKSYHEDHGEGYDPYHVGGSRGCGGLAVWSGDSLAPSSVYASWKLIANGPIRTIFELTYDSFEVNGRRITEVKRVSIDLGSRLTRFESSFMVDGRPARLEVAVGVTTHDGAAESGADKEAGWIRCWEQIDGSSVGTGAVLSPGILEKVVVLEGDAPDDDHILALAHTSEAGKLVYYAGYAWALAGEITTEKAWEEYLSAFALRADHPPKVSVR